jgi:hypothetical protein
MRSSHHRLQRRFDRTLGIGEEVGDAGQRLVASGIEDVKDCPNEKRMTGLFPVDPL